MGDSVLACTSALRVGAKSGAEATGSNARSLRALQLPGLAQVTELSAVPATVPPLEAVLGAMLAEGLVPCPSRPPPGAAAGSVLLLEHPVERTPARHKTANRTTTTIQNRNGAFRRT